MSASSPDNEREEDVSSTSDGALAIISRDAKHVPESLSVWGASGDGDGLLSGSVEGAGVADAAFLARRLNSALKSMFQGSCGKRAPGVPFRIYIGIVDDRVDQTQERERYLSARNGYVHLSQLVQGRQRRPWCECRPGVCRTSLTVARRLGTGDSRFW